MKLHRDMAPLKSHSRDPPSTSRGPEETRPKTINSIAPIEVTITATTHISPDQTTLQVSKAAIVSERIDAANNIVGTHTPQQSHLHRTLRWKKNPRVRALL